MSTLFLGQPIWLWGVFLSLILGLMIFDLRVLNRRDHVMGMRESLRLTSFYMMIALLFGIWVHIHLGADHAINYYTGYVIEQSLSLDNVFVISVIMSYFAIPRELQHRVLFWGIIGVIVLRGLVIGFGTAIVHEFEWILLVFAGILIYTGFHMLKGEDEKIDLEHNVILNFLRRRLNFTSNFHGHAFFVRLPDPKTGKRILFATPLFMALATVELADIIFAFDSLPAVLAITTDPFIVFSSNLFAIIGLRALYFVLAAMMARFQYLKYALSFVLIFIGLKVIYQHLPESYQILGEIDPLVSLTITLATLLAGALSSIMHTTRRRR